MTLWTVALFIGVFLLGYLTRFLTEPDSAWCSPLHDDNKN